MKLVPSRFVPGLTATVVAISSCFAVATMVEAQTPPPAKSAPDARPRPPMPPGEHGPGEHGPGMHHMRELERFKTSLALNAQQAALWDRATAAMKPPADMREQMKARHDRMETLLNDPNFDPRKVASETDALVAERQARMKSIREAWFAVYDSLNPTQKGQAREFMRQHMMGMGGHHGGGMRGGRGEWMHYEGRGPMPPMPPGGQAAPPAPAAR
jgi:Spy/CpxP family protein refolding chaperone